MIIVDLDGTMCDNTHRRHLVPVGDAANVTDGWIAFNKACADDEPIQTMIDLLRMFKANSNHQTVYVTGRGAQAREETEQWIAEHIEDDFVLIMRPESDHRKAHIIKHDIFKMLGVREGDIVMEDDPAIIKMVHQYFDAIVITPPSRCSAVLNQAQNK